MKILFSIKAMDDIKGGVERVIADISGGLAGRGCEVSLLSFDKPGGNSFYPLHKNIRRICLGTNSANRKTSTIETLTRLGTLRRTVKIEKPDVVIAFMHSMFIPVIIALIGTNIPVIASEHIVPQHYKGKNFEYLLLVICGIMATRITVLSEKIKDLYPAILRSRMVAVPNAVHAPAVHADPAASHSGRKNILNIGRLTPQKNQVTLIDAFAILAPRFPEWDVHIIGEGVLHDDLQKRIDELGLQSRIILAGTTNRIDREYLQANIFALPSLYESFGLVTAEAMSFGLPALGFADCPGTNELIKDGENGLLVESKDRVSNFAIGLEKLMNSADLRLRLGQNGIITAAQFTPDKILNAWEALIRETLAKKP